MNFFFVEISFMKLSEDDIEVVLTELRVFIKTNRAN